MKINAAPGFNNYQSYMNSLKNGEAAGQNSAQVKSQGTHTDKVTLSDSATAHVEASRVASSVATEVNSAGSPERIAALTAQVQAGEYHVSTDDLADAILGRVI